MESPVPARHSGRHSRGLSPLAAQRHAQIHRDQAARRSRQGSDWPQAAAAALLRRLYHPHLSAFHDGSLGERYAGVDRPDGDDRILSFFSGACPAVYSEILPTRVRYTALSIGYNIAVAVFGGFAPFIATWLIGVTGSNLAPSYYLIAAATITFLVVLRIRETAFEPLR